MGTAVDGADARRQTSDGGGAGLRAGQRRERRAGGVATIELDGKKERFIFDAKAFQRTDSPAFSTVLVVFRADTSGHIERYKKLLLDPTEPLTEIKTLSIQDWSQKQWPALEIQYDTHVAGRDSFATIEWHSIFDANRDQFVSRLPFGITRKVPGGPEQSYAFSIRRNSPTTLLIADLLGGRSIPMTAPNVCCGSSHAVIPVDPLVAQLGKPVSARVTVRHAAVASGKFTPKIRPMLPDACQASSEDPQRAKRRLQDRSPRDCRDASTPRTDLRTVSAGRDS
jgi:hypothetical protein